jgi:multidrug efflux pump subunit AcrA (membrane-fusion protein)
MINFVIPILLLSAAAAVVMLLGTVEPEQRPAADTTRAGRLRALPPVRVESLRSLESTGEQLHLEVDGTVVPFREARVAAEVAGRVIFKAVECEAGSYVKEDQLLMRIDPTDYQLEVQRLSRLQEQEYEALGEVDQEMLNTKRLIDVAQQDVALQQKEVDRQKALPAGFASRAEIDQANRALLASTQQLVIVENQLDLLRKRRVRLEASERLAATQLKAAEVNLSRVEIRAPIEGVIVNEDADLNTFVARGDMLVTIEDTSKVEVATNLRMDQLYWVLDQQGKKVDESERGYNLPETPAIIEYQLSGREDLVYRWHGRLLSYDGIGLDPVTRTVPVRVVVDNPSEYFDATGKVKSVRGATALVRGMYVQVQLLIQPQTRLVVIPARALQPGNRVFQFVPDESVLGDAARDVSSKDEMPVGARAKDARPEPEFESAPQGNDAVAEEASKEPGRFDPSRWEPGRVFVRQSVNPVDSLTMDDDSQPNDAMHSEFAGQNRMWVCEVRDESLQGGSYVVVSPLGSVDDEALPVRADRKGIIDARDQAQPKQAVESTATTDQGKQEEA